MKENGNPPNVDVDDSQAQSQNRMKSPIGGTKEIGVPNK